jgi:hypothetical protein
VDLDLLNPSYKLKLMLSIIRESIKNRNYKYDEFLCFEFKLINLH